MYKERRLKSQPLSTWVVQYQVQRLSRKDCLCVTDPGDIWTENMDLTSKKETLPQWLVNGARRRRRRTNINSSLRQRLVFPGWLLVNPVNTKHLYTIYLFIQRRSNVFDVGPTLYKCYYKWFVFTGMESVSLACRAPQSETLKQHLEKVGITLLTPKYIYYHYL